MKKQHTNSTRKAKPKKPVLELSVHAENIESSSIKTISYSDGDLTIEMVNGKAYSYDNVPAQVIMDFLKSPSYGAFFNKEIRNCYAFTCV